MQTEHEISANLLGGIHGMMAFSTLMPLAENLINTFSKRPF